MAEWWNMQFILAVAILLLFRYTECVPPNDDYFLERFNFGDGRENSPTIEEDKTWTGLPQLRQVSGLAVDGDGNLHIFHRGDRVWNSQTFDDHHRLTSSFQQPIPNDTVLVIDPNNGKLLYSWGSNRFYMPHGLTVDRQGNSWITDVGLHQVMKFPAREEKPELILGESLVPGSDSSHFCKPTDVAVTPTGYFFVSDGYCNSRIMMFTRNGRLMKEIGKTDGMRIPHSLTLVPEHDAVCVADRENLRVLCYATGTDGTVPGMPLASFEGQGLERVYAISTRGKQLFAVNGPGMGDRGQSGTSGRGVVIDIESRAPSIKWGPSRGFYEAHDIALSPDGQYAYVSEVDLTAPKRVYKFNLYD